MERRINQFQTKVQQNINIANDQLRQCSEYYGLIQAEIKEIQDRIRKLDRHYQQAHNTKDGKEKRKSVIYKTKISQFNSRYQNAIQQLIEQQSKEIQEINDDFESTLLEIEAHNQNLIEEKCQPIERQIQITTHKIEQTKEKIQKIQGKTITIEEDLITDFDSQRISSLEESIQNSNNERLKRLIRAKNQLTDCVRSLENMESNHTAQIENLQQQLTDIETDYQNKLKNKTDQINQLSKIYHKKIADLENKNKILKKSLQLNEANFQTLMTSAANESAQVTKSITNIKRSQRESLSKCNEMQSAKFDYDELKRKLEKSEKELIKEREENDRLKREIARIVHQRKIAKRRAELGLI
ncbi:hypothetical protein GPJ56_002018 [Histomonas meleagridis]|uniref:uncharacterized protein n=1 Tax=Histomonas meleagridis TaxID=135588 RepID=UPI003559FD6F|nr:hypothetical protein GPJ56_002018 [Histomonas meleagridis]KAH0800905.1 hypothetical protein GO595_006221 [Histomonas meleagridis]